MAKSNRTMLVDGYQPRSARTERGYQAQNSKPGVQVKPVKPPKLPKTTSAISKSK